jgi:predicted membrane channel-forming protein YqfA (hemolysin III family)
MAGVGWVLLYRLIDASKPLALQRWLFFILFYIAITGTALPFIWYLNQRFSRARPATGGILLREGMWCGLAAVLAAWLQMIRALNGATVFFLALGVIAVEAFLRYRERGQAPVESASRSSTIHD